MKLQRRSKKKHKKRAQKKHHKKRKPNSKVKKRLLKLKLKAQRRRRNNNAAQESKTQVLVNSQSLQANPLVNRKLGMFPQIPGTPGSESPTFPPLIPNDETPIIINSPPVELPKKQKPQNLQGHIIFVPTIIYPKKKKRIIVHHENSMMGYYNNYLHGMNGYYLNWFKQNPGYKDWLKNNQYWQAALKDKKMQEYMKKVNPGDPPKI